MVQTTEADSAPAATGEPTVAVDRLAVTYRSFGTAPVHALRDFSLRVHAGEIVGVLGPNGSGKTSLLGVLSGNLMPSSGQARILGCRAFDSRLLGRVGYQPESALPFRTCTPLTFLQRIAGMLGQPFPQSRAPCLELLARVGLGDVAQRRKVGKLSTGMARRLGLAAALLGDPAVLLLDEPTSGLDPDGSLLVMDLLRARAAAGGTVLLASHHLQEVEQICDRVVMLHGGQKVAEGTLDQLLGTAQTELLVEGLDGDGLAAATRHIAALGGRVVQAQRRREHLFALFRRLRQGGDA